jgi:hypothetical protein
VETFHKNILFAASMAGLLARSLSKIGIRGVPPSPTRSECRDWRGFRKNALQNLEPLGLKGQNIDNKGLAAFF